MGILLKSKVDHGFKGKCVAVFAHNTESKEKFYIGSYKTKEEALLNAPTILDLKIKNPTPRFKAFLDGKKFEENASNTLK